MKRKQGLLLLLLLAAALLCSCALLQQPEPQPCVGEHRFEVQEITQKPTCGVAGVQTVRCKLCGHTEEQTVEPTGQHRLQGFVTTVSPTLESAGERVQVCERCALTVEREELIPIGAVARVQTTGERFAVSLADYTLVYDGSVSGGFYTGALEHLARAVSLAAGKEIAVKKASDVPVDKGEAEILVGDTNRAISDSAAALIKGDGFAVVAEGNRIAIVGSDELQTIQAIQYVIRTYLTDTQTPTLFPRAVASNVPMQTLATDKSCDYEVVFDRKLHNEKQHKHIPTSTSDSRDYPCIVAESLAESLGRLAEGEAKALAVRSDETTTPQEVLLGTMERVDAQYFLSLLEGDEYGILVKDGKVILAARNDQALDACVEEFLSLLHYSIYDTDEGGYAYCLPEGFYAMGRVEADWVMDFPKPTGEGIALVNTQYVNDGSLQFLYTGSGVDAGSYLTYCDTLLSAGYTVLTENSIEGSLFKTLVHPEKEITLYVAYNDFKYKEDYAVEDAYTADFQKCIRIISATTDDVTLPDAGLLSANPTYTKVADTSVTALPYEGQAVGMGYVLQLEDGRFIVIDGGGVNEGGSEYQMLWNTLSTLHEKTSGSVAGAGNPVHIAAWINTHSHGDHYNAFCKMLQKYGSVGFIKMDYLLGNFPDESVIYAVKGETLLMGQSATIKRLQGYVNGGFTYVKVHTGQKFYLANATLEVLTTFEDHFPRRICNSNDTCTVVRFSLASSEAADKAPTTALFLADAFRFQSRILCAMYGNYLRSDIVQVAHHGNIGCEKEIYATVAPTAVLFPNTYEQFLIYTDEARKNVRWNYAVDYFVVHELESVKYIFVADSCCVTLPFTKDGPDYDCIYNTETGEALHYNNGQLIKK